MERPVDPAKGQNPEWTSGESKFSCLKKLEKEKKLKKIDEILKGMKREFFGKTSVDKRP